MTADDIKAKIDFTERRNEWGDTIITGRIEFGAEMMISRHLKEPKDYAKDHIREQIVRNLFEDQRNALHEACDGLMHIDPHNYSEWHKAFSKLLAAAKYQETHQEATE